MSTRLMVAYSMGCLVVESKMRPVSFPDCARAGKRVAKKKNISIIHLLFQVNDLSITCFRNRTILLNVWSGFGSDRLRSKVACQFCRKSVFLTKNFSRKISDHKNPERLIGRRYRKTYGMFSRIRIKYYFFWQNSPHF